jgi:hypothetical protein
MHKKIMALYFLFTLLLTGCLTTEGLQRNVEPNLKENGLILLPVTDRALFTATGASFVVSDLNGKRTTLTVKDWPEEIPQKDGKGKRFYGAFTLPPGEYKFLSWYLVKTEGSSAKEPNEPFTFRLNKGEVIYVGNFNAIRPLGTGQFRDRFAEDVKKFQSIYPWLNDLNVKQQLITGSWWTLPGGTEPK